MSITYASDPWVNELICIGQTRVHDCRAGFFHFCPVIFIATPVFTLRFINVYSSVRRWGGGAANAPDIPPQLQTSPKRHKNEALWDSDNIFTFCLWRANMRDGTQLPMSKLKLK